MQWGALWWCQEYWRYCWGGHPGGQHWCTGAQLGVQHGWQLTHDGDNGWLTAWHEEAGSSSVGNI